jgi:CheY-like chemotaxis protein
MRGRRAMAKRGPIMVVDDEEAILEFVQMTLEDEGYEVLTATDGQGSLEVVRELCPAMILLDLRTPVMGG